jgi:histidine triad (HIT) family protein
VANGDCLFCGIAAGSVHTDLLHSDDDVVAFRDIAPRAPTHILLIPKRHIDSAAELDEGDAALVGRLFLVARDLARSEGVAESGFRIVTNTGTDAGQSVAHLHFHLLGGRSFAWPPG